MPHLVPLLIRGINNLSDARYCAGMGADKLSFLLDPALPGHLDSKTVKELAGWVSGVELIGEFEQLNAPAINAIAADCGLDAVLLRTHRTAAELAEIAPPVYLEFPMPVTAAATLLPGSALGVVIELPADISAETMQQLQEMSARLPLWLGPGLDPKRALSLVSELNLAGLVFPSGDELKPGLRDFDQLETVFEALEID